MEEPYELVLKTYQLKEIFLSAGISLTLHDCEKLLKSGFCQSASRLIRKHVNILSRNREIEAALIGITHKDLLSSSDTFQRTLPLIEEITSNDLISFASTGLYIIEYIASVLYMSEKTDNILYREQIKDELSGLTVAGSVESLIFIKIFLNDELNKELKLLSARSQADLKEALFSLVRHLLKITGTNIIYVPEGLRTVDRLIDKFIKGHDEIDMLLEEIKHNEFNIIKSLHHILIPILDTVNEDTVNEEDKLTVLLFKYIHRSVNLLSIALEETEDFFYSGNLYNLITAIQLLSICSSMLTLMIDRRNILFQAEDSNADRFINYLTGKCDKEEILLSIEEEMNNLYMKQELEGNITYEHVIRDYKKSIELLCEETNNLRSLSAFLKGQNRLLTMTF
jgi:hypothetical protein